MTGGLNEDVVQRVSDLGTAPWSGQAYRHTTTGRDPLSGMGARMFGGRWNPKGAFSTIYVASPLATCMLEFNRLAASQQLEPRTLLRSPRTLHTVAVSEASLLDLRSTQAATHVGLADVDLGDDDWTACQSVGHAAYFLEMDGVIANSATGQGLVVALFEVRLRPGTLSLVSSRDLTLDTYTESLQATK